MSKKQWYFAYGSNLDVERYEIRIEHSNYETKLVKLTGYSFKFNKDYGDTTRANIMLNPKGVVYGVIYSASNADFKELDKAEGAKYSCEDDGHYEKKQVTLVEYPTGKKISGKVIAYIACPCKILDDTPPPREYLDYIVNGGNYHGLNKSYIRKIKNLATKLGMKG